MRLENSSHIPFVTVGIPVYNAARVISHAIQSVLNQTFSDFELIIIDDGSTDDTWQIINSFSDERIIAIKGEKNLGISARLNQQIAMAKGKYFARMDADDVMMKERLSVQLGFLLSHPEVDVVGSSAIVMDERYNILGIRGRRGKEDDHDLYYCSKDFMHPTVVGKTEWFKNNLYNLDYCGYEDYELWSRTYKHSVFCNLNSPLLFYQDHTCYELSKSISNKVKGLAVYCHVILSGNNCMDAIYQLFRNLLAIPIIVLAKVFRLDRHLIGMRNDKLTEKQRKEYECVLADIFAKENHKI